MEFRARSRTKKQGHWLVIPLGAHEDTARRAPIANIDCVIDIDQDGEVLGVEILNLGCITGVRLPHTSLRSAPVPGVSWSYDKTVDAFYVRLAEGRSVNQRPTTCNVHLNADGSICELEVRTWDA